MNLEYFRGRLKAAIQATLDAENAYTERAEDDNGIELRDRLTEAEKAEDAAREELRYYTRCHQEGHGPLKLCHDTVSRDGWVCICPDCQGCQDDEGNGAPEYGRGATEQEAFDDYHERIGTND